MDGTLHTESSYIAIQEAARILKVSEKTLRRWEEKNVLVPIRTPGGHRRYTLLQIQEFKKQRKLKAHPVIETSDAFLATVQPSAPMIVKEEVQPIPVPQHTSTTAQSVNDQFEDSALRTPARKLFTPTFKLPRLSFPLHDLVSTGVFALSFLLFFLMLRLIPSNAVSQYVASMSFPGRHPQFVAQKATNTLIAQKKSAGKVLGTQNQYIQFTFNVDALFNENVTIKKDASISGTLAVNSGSLTTSATSANIFTQNATTIAVGSAGTAISIGSTSGTTTINNATTAITGVLNLVGNRITSPGDLTIDPGGGAVLIGTGTANNADLAGGDLYVSDDIELDGTLYGPTANISGVATIGTISVNSDSITDFTGTGLLLSGGSLQASLGTSIQTAEIDDGAITTSKLADSAVTTAKLNDGAVTNPKLGDGSVSTGKVADEAITEPKLLSSNDGTNGYVLSYNSSTGGFTWIPGSTDSGFSDTGTLITLSTTTDDVNIGGLTDLGKLAVVGDSDETQLLVRGDFSQTVPVFDIQNSSGTSFFNVSAAGVITIPGLDCTTNANAGTLTADASGVISCQDDDGGGASSPFQTTSSVANLIISTNDTTLGSAIDLAKFAVDGDSNEIQFLIQGNGTQTNFLGVFEQSSGVDVFTIANNGDLVTAGDIAVNGGDITTTSTTASIFNSNATTINFGQAATTMNIGVLGGTTTIASNVTITGTLTTASSNFAADGAATFSPSGTNDVTMNLDADSTLILNGVQSGTASNALCLDGSNNVITCQSAVTITLKDAYDNDPNGSNVTIPLTSADDSIIFQNPAAAGTDSGYVFLVDQLNTGNVDGIQIDQAGTGDSIQLTNASTGSFLNLSATGVGTTADGISIVNTSSGVITDAIDASDAEIVNALNTGANTILGTTAVIDFTNFDVDGSGNITASGNIVASTNETINGIDITAGTVSDVVNLTINGGGDLTIGAIGLNDTGTSNTDSGASLVGTFDEFTNSNGTTVQGVLKDLDSAIGAGASKWTDGGAITYLTSITDDIAVGATNTLVAPFSVDVSANLVRIGTGATANAQLDMYASDGDTGSLVYNTSDQFNFTGGDVLIGQALTVTGNTTANGDLTANGTFTLGDNGDAGAIDTNDWDISTTGVFTGVSGITTNGGYTQSGAGTNLFTGATTISGGTTLLRNLTVNSGTTQNVASVAFTSPVDTSGTNVTQGLSITPTIGNASGGTNTVNVFNIDGTTGDAQVTLNAINVGALSGGTGASEIAINVGTGWDSLLSVNSSTVINGSGVLQSNGLSGTYSNALTLSSTSNAITAGTLTINTDAFTDLTGNGLAISTGSLGVNLTTSGGSGSTSSNSGLEVSSAGLTLLKGCAQDEILSWDDAGSVWICNSVTGAGGGTGDITAVGDVTSGAAFTQTAGADGTTLYFEGSTTDGNEIALTTADPGADITVTIPNIAGTLASLAGTQSFTGAKTFSAASIFDGTITANTDTDFALAGSENITLTNASASTDQLALAVSGVTTTGVNGLSVAFTQADDVDATDSNAAVNVALTSSSGDADTLYGLKFADFTAGAATENAIHFGTGFDNLFDIEGNTADGNDTLVTYAEPTGSRSIIIPDDSGTICLSSGNCAGGAGGSKWTDAGAVTYLTATSDDLAVGGTTLASPFSIDVSANLVRIGTGATANAQLDMYASDGDTGSLVYTTSDQFSFTGGDVLVNQALTANGTFTLGDNGDTGAIDTSDWDISTTGVLTGVSGITTNGGYTQSGATANTLTGATTISGGTTLSRTLAADATAQNVASVTFTTPADTTGTNLNQGISITPTIGNATAGTNTANIFNIDALTGDAQVTLNAVNIGALTGTGATETAINIGTGWDNVLSVGGTPVINGSGQLVSTQITGTLFSTNSDSGSSTVVQGDTLAINGGTNGINTALSGDTYTLNFDSTEVGTTTWNAGGTDPTWTFNTSGGTDPTLAFANNQITVGNAATLTATAVTTFNCTNCINFDDISDTLVLDAATTITRTSTTTSEDSLAFSLINNGGTAGTDRAFVISNGLSGNSSGDVTTESLLTLDQADSTAGGNTAVTDGLLITNSGGSTFTNAITIGSGSQAISTGLNIASTGVTTDISLQNGETIDNNVDGTIQLTAANTALSGDLAISGGNITTAFTADSTVTVTGTTTANGSLVANGIFTLGDNGDTGAINTSDWDISATGDMSGIGAITADGAIAFTPGSTSDITFTLDSDSTLILAGVQTGTASNGLCLDSSNNVITCSTAGSTTLQSAYNSDVDGSDTIIALTTADDSLIFRNPASSGTDSTYILTLDQLANSSVGGLNITQAGTGAGIAMTFSNAGTTTDGLIINNSAGTVTDAIDVSDATGFTNAINVGANTILGTTAAIDLTNFDVAGTGNITTATGTGIDCNAASCNLKVGVTNATTIDVGTTAATAINIGAGGALARNIAIGTGTGADTINIGTGATGADAITIGNAASTTALAFNSGTSAQTFTSQVQTGTTTTSGFVFDATAINTGTGLYLTSDSITTGKLAQIATTGNTLTTGTLLDVNSTSTAVTGSSTGLLGYLNWNPGSATTATGDLFRINIGSNGNVGNLFNLTDNGTSLFSVSETQITNALPTSFTAAGDVSFANDIQFTNQVASAIKSKAPLTIEAGESFESNDLTLHPYNAGSVVIDGSTTPTTSTTGLLNINANAGNAAVIASNINLIQDNGATAAVDAIGQQINLTANDADGDVFGLKIAAAATTNATTGSYEAGITIDNAEDTAASMTDGILITSSGINNGITDAIDVSAANINNAINLGANFELFDGIRMFEGATGTLTIEDTSGNDIATFVDGGTTGSLTVTNTISAQGNSIGLNNDASANNVLAFGTGPGAATGDLYWGDKLLCTAASANCGWGAAGAGMTSFTAAGDSGSNQTISDGNTFAISGGTNGIDTVGVNTDIIRLDLDTTEISGTTSSGASTFSDGTQASIAWTFNTSGATDPILTMANSSITLGNAATIVSDQATLAAFNTTTTDLSIGGAATTFNLAAGGALARAINLGTGTGVDTINVGTGGTGADVINIGSTNAGNVSVKSNAVLNLTGGANSVIDFPNFDVATTGNVTTATGTGIDCNAASCNLKVGATNATTVDIGTTAATAINIGAGGALARNIAIGTGTGADVINIGTGATGADTITIGNSASTTSLAFNSGTGSQTFTSQDATGTTTSSAFVFTDNALSTGTGMYLNSSTITTGKLAQFTTTGSTLTSGSLLDLSSAATSITNGSSIANGGTFAGSLLNISATGAISSFAGNLGTVDWSPGSATNATGNLFTINIGTNGTTSGDLFQVQDSGSDLFAVNESAITSSIPHNFTAAGDLSVAYDLSFTNQTASTIKTLGPLTIDAGESFESNNLTLHTYNSGKIIADGGFSFNEQQALTDSTTPDVGGASYFLENNSTNRVVTNFLNGTAGQIIYIEIGTAANFDLACTASKISCGSTTITAMATGDTIALLYDGTTWNLLSWMDQSANNSDNTDGVDLAEFFPSSDTLEAGDLISIDGSNPVTIKKGTETDGQKVVGIISTQPGLTLGQEAPTSYKVALAGRVPVKIDPNSPEIHIGDFIGATGVPGKAKKVAGGYTVGRALENWQPGSGKDTVTVFVSSIWIDPDMALSTSGDISIAQTVDGQMNTSYNLVDPRGIMNRIGEFADAVIANLRVGKLSSTEIATSNLKINGKTVQEIVSEAVTQATAGATLATNVVTKDEAGNATISGNLTAHDATISGTLYADRISGLDGITSLLGSQNASLSALISQFNNWNSSASAVLSADAVFANEYLNVQGTASITDAMINHTLIVGGSLAMDHNSINLLSDTEDTLYLQATTSGKLDLLAGTVTLSADGGLFVNTDAVFAKDLTVKEDLIAHSLKSDGQVLGIQLASESGKLTVSDANSTEVASIDASGSATFSKLALTHTATSSANVNLDASAGKGTLPSGQTELVIYTNQVTEDSLIYITPNSSTENKVLYVKSKVAKDENDPESVGSFTIGVDSSISNDVKLNWWIIN
ncbi:MAG: MerR family DNA-binding transcriptional regulator [Candidatus Woesebacteria bacterium]